MNINPRAGAGGSEDTVRGLLRLVGLSMLACLLTGMRADTMQAQRTAFKQAWTAIHVGHLQKADKLMASLHHYVLYPYLVFARLDYQIRRLPGVFDDDQAVEHFLTEHGDLPVAAHLHHDWLRSLAYRKRWRTFLAHYHGSHAGDLRCAAVNARLQIGKHAHALRDALDLWRHGYSLPKQCDAVFAWLKGRGELTPARTTERLDLALNDDHFGLARYLAKSLPADQKSREMIKIDLYEHPYSELKQAAGKTHGKLPTAWVTNALQRLAGDAPKPAARLYQRLNGLYHFSDADRQNIARRIGDGLAWNHDPAALKWFSRVDAAFNTDVSREWRVRAALFQHDWNSALMWIDDLPASQRASDKWRYWRARSLAETGHHNEAKALYRRLAKDTGYYALLAADHVDMHYGFVNHPLTPDSTLEGRIAGLPGMIRARELFLAGLPRYARREWRQALAGRPAAWHRQAALLAKAWGWHDQSIRALVRGGAGDDLNLRYPTAFLNPVLNQAHALSLQPAWIYGIMRSESLFSPRAVSSTGARGLMQLMPGTAHDVASHIGLNLDQPDALFTPAVNVRLGSHYLQQMVQRFDGSLVAATAAYNAGPKRVADWLPDKPIAADIWVENIPYVETRHYVKRVMAYSAVFDWRLHGHMKPLSARMPPVAPASPEVVATDTETAKSAVASAASR